MLRALSLVPVLLTFLACATPPAPIVAEGRPNWDMLADLDTVQVVTADADGEARVTTIWLAIVDEQGYIRTGDSRWFANLKRDPALKLRAGGAEYALKSEFVDEAALNTRIDAAFRTKYGFSDRLVSFFRGAGANRIRLVPR